MAIDFPNNPSEETSLLPTMVRYVFQDDKWLGSTTANATTVSTVPTGSVTAFAGSTAPDGWLECNGQATTGYDALAAVVGTNVPDLRGEFY